MTVFAIRPETPTTLKVPANRDALVRVIVDGALLTDSLCLGTSTASFMFGVNGHGVPELKNLRLKALILSLELRLVLPLPLPLRRRLGRCHNQRRRFRHRRGSSTTRRRKGNIDHTRRSCDLENKKKLVVGTTTTRSRPKANEIPNLGRNSGVSRDRTTRNMEHRVPMRHLRDLECGASHIRDHAENTMSTGDDLLTGGPIIVE